MSYPGYTYDPRQNYGQQSGPSIPHPTYDAATYPAHAPESGFSSYGYPQNTIPGLGMGFPSGGNAQYQQLHPAPTYGMAGGSFAEPPTGVGHSPQAPDHGAVAAEDDEMDEGEIDEGEVDDVYDPAWPQGSSTALRAADTTGRTNVTELGTNPDSPEQERASYSPFLTPQEVALEPVEAAADRGQLPESSEDSKRVPESFPPLAETLSIARKQAQDAILRLWPLNVRFQDYIDADIDETILRELFLELGFDMESSSTKEGAVASSALKGAEVPNKSLNQRASVSAPSATAVIDSAKSAAETRKDRIARRLAASKSSDLPARSPELSKPSPAPNTQAPVSGKINPDKSRLVREKMEALRKAREAKQLASSTGGDTGQGFGTTQPTSQPSEVVDVGKSDSLSSQMQASDAQRTEPIPGLAFSSTPRPPSSTTSKRPSAAELNEDPEEPFKRPFRHPRQPQKFLIDVSDDDDDEAMDLDSPEISSASVNKTNSPFKIPSFPETQQGFMSRQTSSPMPTPPIPTPSGEDLESKMKDIEEMKRKIAQREAEVRARASRPASPAVGAIGAPPRAASVASSSAVITPDVSTSSLAGTPLKAVPTTEFAAESQKLPKPSDMKHVERARAVRSRSRAASERLITEAQAKRREKELKLQLMRNQIKKMEREIQESVDAEKKIRAEAEESEEEEDEEQAVGSMQTDAGLGSEISISAGHHREPAPVTPDHDPNNPSRNDAATGVVEEEDLESDAAAAISSSEEEAGMTPELAQPGDNPQSYKEPNPPPQMEQLTTEKPMNSAAEGDDSSDQNIEKVMRVWDNAQSTVPAEPASSSMDDSEEGEIEPAEEDQRASSPLGDSPVVEAEPQSESSDSEIADVSNASPVPQPISTGQAESKPASPREEQERSRGATDVVGTTQATSFTPYESLLKTFRAYRFHPDFSKSVPGGLRSLTYSNEIDPKLPICPDELATGQCPRGAECMYQHFDKMQAPDDKILMQLGSYGNLEGEQKNEYNNGLKQILTDARTKKIKDFDTLAKSIIDYRQSFKKDPYKILPLGDVKL